MATGGVPTETDLLVAGGGPGGYVAAIRAGQRGLDVALVERAAYGGTCLNHGCIPSKALITATDLAHEAGHAEAMGVHADPEVDFGGMTDWKDGVVDQLTGGVEKLCKANGVALVWGTARFLDDRTVRVERAQVGRSRGRERDAPEGTVEIGFERAVVATGSRPAPLPGFDFGDDPVLSSRDALALEAVPDRLVVVGAGYIGMELSTTFAKLGADVTVLEALPAALPGYEDDVARVVRKRAEELGVTFAFEEGATGWRDAGDGIVVETDPGDGEAASYPADRVLVAVGRRPVTDTLAVENAGLEPDGDGFLPTDDRAETDVPGIFAVGDVAGEPMLAHKAAREGVVAAEVAAGESAALDYRAVPAAVFTDPEVGTVGLTEAAAAEAGHDPVVGEMPFRASGRALTTGRSEGFVRVVADADSGFLLGAQIVGPEASELIAEPALAIELGATLADIGGTVHTHPTLAEAVMEAAENARGQAIHTLNR